MTERDLLRVLRSIFRRESRDDRGGQDRLEHELVESYRRDQLKAKQGARLGSMTNRLRTRAAWMGIAVLALAVTAEAISVRSSLVVGAIVKWQLQSSAPPPAIDDLLGFAAVEFPRLEVSFSSSVEAESDELIVIAFGDMQQVRTLVRELGIRFPNLALQEPRIEVLEGPWKTSLARYLGNRLLAISVHPDQIATAKREIIEELARRGLVVSRIDLDSEDGGRKLQIEIEAR